MLMCVKNRGLEPRPTKELIYSQFAISKIAFVSQVVEVVGLEPTMEQGLNLIAVPIYIIHTPKYEL